MPERVYKKTNKIDTAEVQGEGSYVIMRRLTWGDVEELAAQEAGNNTRLEIARNILPHYLDEWNWVDDQGNPLPSPKENFEVIEGLVGLEVNFLLTKLMELRQTIIQNQQAKN